MIALPLALVAALVAFTAFALSTDAHHRRRLGGVPTKTGRRLFRRTAWATMVVCFLLSVAARGWIFGPITWFGLIMLAAGTVFLFLNLAPGGKTR